MEYSMSALMKTLGIDRMSREERLDLFQEIWESLEAECADDPPSDEQKSEIDRRLAAYKENPNSSIAWEQVEAEALARIRK
jgi:putative addiction module component (TIGR02574 family)